jgi:hypothetical protein
MRTENRHAEGRCGILDERCLLPGNKPVSDIVQNTEGENYHVHNPHQQKLDKHARIILKPFHNFTRPVEACFFIWPTNGLSIDIFNIIIYHQSLDYVKNLLQPAIKAHFGNLTVEYW